MLSLYKNDRNVRFVLFTKTSIDTYHMEGVMTGTRSEFVKEFNENAVQFLWNWGQNCKFYSMSVSKVHHFICKNNIFSVPIL